MTGDDESFQPCPHTEQPTDDLARLRAALTCPPTLVIGLPWGRFHATPWARHVNEGEVELPPSWRLLRALYAVWKCRRPDLDEATVHALLARLAEPPTYLLPPFRVAHTRHYYPDSTRRRRRTLWPSPTSCAWRRSRS